MRKILIWILTFFSSTTLVAQKTEFIFGQVVSESGYPIPQVYVTVGNQKLITNYEGAFVFRQKNGQPPQNVSATRKHYKMIQWSVQNKELVIVMKEPLNLIEGQVVDERLKPIVQTEVAFLGVKIRPVYTNAHGYFTINLPPDFSVKPNTRLLVNGHLVPHADYTYSHVDKFLHIKRLKSQHKPFAHTLTKPPKKEIVSEQPTIHGVKLLVDQQEYQLGRSPNLTLKLPSDEGADVTLNAFKNTQNNGRNVLELHIQRSGMNPQHIKKYTNVEEYDKNIHNFKKEIRRQKTQRNRINKEIRMITKKLTYNVDSVKRVGLQRYLKYLENIIYENDSVYKNSRVDTEILMKEIQGVLNEKDSIMNIQLHQLKNAQKNSKIALERQAEAERERDKIIKLSMGIALVALIFIVMAVVVYRDRHKIKQQKHELEFLNNKLVARNDEIQSLNQEITIKNSKITDSIRYAETIQRAILPSKELMKRELKDYFIFYRPKDIVSGDFYWFSKVSDQDYLIATVDCTGHGVSGAFMSLIGNTTLNEIVNDVKVHTPSVILEELDKRIRVALKQEQKINDDGMDVCLCRLQKQKDDHTLVTFTGAKRPLFYMRKGSPTLQVLKGDNRSIGGGRKRRKRRKPFTEQNIQLTSGSLLYLMSDGFTDQNGSQKPKIGTLVFKELITDNAQLPMPEQKELLNQIIELHQGGQEQRDDITVLGIKL